MINAISALSLHLHLDHLPTIEKQIFKQCSKSSLLYIIAQNYKNLFMVFKNHIASYIDS